MAKKKCAVCRLKNGTHKLQCPRRDDGGQLKIPVTIGVDGEWEVTGAIREVMVGAGFQEYPVWPRRLSRVRIPPPCLVCGKELQLAFPDLQKFNQPSDAVVFVAHGMYGSTVFDSGEGHQLEVVICDACLVSASKMTPVRVLKATPVPVLDPPPVYDVWEENDV